MKKIIKKILKVLGSIVGIILVFVALCCVVTLGWGVFQMHRGSVMDLPETADDFVPEVRVMIFTDPHCYDVPNGDNRVGAAIDKAYELFDDNETYAGIDAIFGLGDFSSIGYPDDYDTYISLYDGHVREDTLFVNLLGNHEMKRKDCADIFVEKFGYDPNGVYEINGFTFIAFSGERSLTEWTFTPSSLKWLSEQIDEAEEKAGDKAVFVLQHPHNFGTVYGSTIWCTPQTNVVLNGHNKVVDFSGHSHYPMNDPRSINQTTYTSVGVGALCRFELDKNYITGQHPDGYNTANQFCILEADSNGRVRILEYDVNSDTFFNEYFIENVNDTSTYAYTYKNLKSKDSDAPVFADDTKASASKNENGEWVLSFDEASDFFIVQNYTIKITDENGKTVLKDTFIDDYYVIDDDDTADFRIGLDTLESGKTYNVSIVAENAYHVKSDELNLTFQAE